MKFIPFYKETLGCENEEAVFRYFIDNLKPSNTLWSYFVNWEKVLDNLKTVEMSLNTLNYLIGKEDFDTEFKNLLSQQPQLIKTLPLLLAIRFEKGNSKKIQILVDYTNKKLKYQDYDFSVKNPTDEHIEQYLEFVQKTGIKDLIVSRKIKNLVDYIIGIEAGLDSNARKNRGGHIMEDIVEAFILDICNEKGYTYQKEANANKILQEYGISVPVDKSSRRYDFVVNTGRGLVILEVNFYGGGGSKLKSTAAEYRALSTILKDEFKFIWVTDGEGWAKTSLPLREAFNQNDYLFSLDMLEKGILDSIL